MSRTRTAAHVGYLVYPGGPSYPFYRNFRTFTEHRVTRTFTNCDHITHVPAFGQVRSDDTAEYNGFIATNDQFEHALSVARDFHGTPSEIPWHKLPTSSSFNSVAFLAELKESVLMFSTRAIASILKSPLGIHGFLEFGFAPFISDLVAILQLIEIYNNLAVSKVVPFSTHRTDTFSLQGQRVNGLYYYISGTQTTRFSGTVTPDLSRLPQLADFLGFKFDLATVWELTPLSFVVDYFLPIGDFLDAFIRGGWTSSIHFTGSVSENVLLEYNWHDRPTIITKVATKRYKRTFIDGYYPVEKVDPPIDFELPSIKQALNTVYIGLSLLSPSFQKKIDSDYKLRRRIKFSR